MTDRADLEIILASHFPLVTVCTHEEQRTVDLFRMLARRLNFPLSCWSVTDGLNATVGEKIFTADEMRLVGNNLEDDTPRSSTDPETALRVIRNSRHPGIVLMLDFHPFLDEPVHIRLIKEIAQDHELRRQKLIFISHDLSLPNELQRFSASFSLKLPTSIELGNIVADEAETWAAKNAGRRIRADKKSVSALVNNLSGLTRTDARRLVKNAIYDDGAITASDVVEVVKAKRSLIGQSGLLSFEFDTADMSDVGGFDTLKTWLEQRRAQFTATVGDASDTPKGIMLLGVQGGGKSLAAKAVAGIWNIPLLRLDFGVLYNKFFGETERNIREALETAEVLSPCVLWCDEIEKGISTGDYDSGTSKRVLGTLLTWMAENTKPVFIVATANDITALPPELIRKGRLDEIFFVDLPTATVRKDIFEIHLRKRQHDPQRFDLDLLAQASDGFTGAEIEQSIVAASYASRAQDASVSTEFILNELAITKSLSVFMAEEIERLRNWARDRTVSAD